MSNLRSVRRTLTVAALAALAGLAACTDSPNNSGLPTNAGTGLYPSMKVSSSHGTATVSLGLRQVPGGLTFASYQGEVTYDPQKLTFQSAELPDGVFGAANLVSPGHVRFAGTSLDGTAGASVLTMRFATKTTVAKEAFSVSFEEVTEAADMADVTAQVRNGTLLFQQR
jgi:Cohesin domain